MMTIRDINTSDSNYPWVESLLIGSFPEDERREMAAQRINVDDEPRFHCCLAEDDGRPVGLLCYWDFGAFCYCEHFATDPSVRNCGYGSRILLSVLERIERPMVLEVEMPDDEMSRRRIEFYRRQGLRLWEGVEYVQPPYRNGGNSLPMLLMATSGLDESRDAAEVIRCIHRHVYGIRTGLLDDVVDCARCAGAVAMSYFRGRHEMDMHNKLNDSDIVTTADTECESVIKAFICRNYPDHSILSEESGETVGTADYRWVIDPIDGTTNFFAGLPLWGISIGVEHQGRTEFGAVYMPATDELFYASRGAGAYLNGKRLRVSSQTKLSRSVLSTGFPVDKDVNPDNNLDNMAKILPLVRDIRRLGAATADMCYVAAGFLDGYWELNLHEWDVNAASLIVEEAGGKCTRFRNDRGISLLCAPESIHDQLLPLLAKDPRV